MGIDMNSESNERDEDAGIERLLREVGRRDAPAPDVQADIRRAVHQEWRSIVERRTRRKRWVGVAMAASLAVVGLSVALIFSQTSAPVVQPMVVASIAKVHSDTHASVVQVSADGSLWRDVRAGEQLMSGAHLRTDATTRAALDFGNSLSMRIDSGSRLTLIAVDQVVLERGRVYVDAPIAQHVPLTLQTRFGAIDHLGTQYQAQLTDDQLTVSVREGRVAIAAQSGSVQVAANERTAISANGEVERLAIAAHDPIWRWVLQVAPPFDIDNAALADFLTWVARETGRSLNYATPDVQRLSQQLRLRGSIENLNPDQALTAVLATTDFHLTADDSSIAVRK